MEIIGMTVLETREAFIQNFFHSLVSELSFWRVFDTAAIMPKPIMMITLMIIHTTGTPISLAPQAKPPATNTVPIKYITKLDMLILLSV